MMEHKLETKLSLSTDERLITELSDQLLWHAGDVQDMRILHAGRFDLVDLVAQYNQLVGEHGYYIFDSTVHFAAVTLKGVLCPTGQNMRSE